MRISDLDVRDFQGLAGATLGVGAARIVALLGPNEAGKSSILDAVRWALLGRDRTGSASSRDLVRRGAKTASVEMGLAGPAGDAVISRTPAAGSHTIEQTLAAVGVRDRAALEAGLEAARFLALAPRERRALVLRVAGVDLSPEVLAERGVTDAALQRVAAERGLAAAERQAAELKRDRARQADTTARLAPAPTDDEVEVGGQKARLSTLDAAAIEVQLAKLRSRRDELLRAISAGEAGGTERIAMLRGGAEDGEASAAREVEAAGARLADAEYRSRLADAAWKAATDDAEKALAAERYAFEARLPAEPPGHGNACRPRCPTHCPAVPSAEHEAAVANLRGDLVRREAEIMRPREEADAAAVEARRAVALARITSQEATARHKAAQEVAAKKRAEAKELERRGSVDIAPLRSELAALEPRITRGEAIARKLAAFAEAARARIAIEEQVAKIREEARAWERQEHALRPDGPLVALLATPLERFRAAVAPLAQRLLGRAGLAVGDDWSVALDGGPIEFASASARWRAGAACAIALASLSGLRWVALDEASICVGSARDAVLPALLEATGEGGPVDQIWVCSSRGEGEAIVGPPPALAGAVAVFAIVGGRIERRLPCAT